MKYQIHKEDKFEYIETNPDKGKVLLLLHGLFGALSNFGDLINYFDEEYNVVVPMLPLYTLPLRKTSLGSMVQHVSDFIEMKGYTKINLLGNSLGGHIGLLYTLEYLPKVETLTLTGSSGLFESAFGSSFPQRGNYEFIKKKTQDTFFDPEVASKELVDEVFDIVNDRNKAMRVIATAKSAVRQNVGNRLNEITCPCLLIWGKQDKITPPFVGEEFNELLPNSELYMLDHCGHAPMMEQPIEFNMILSNFLDKY